MYLINFFFPPLKWSVLEQREGPLIDRYLQKMKSMSTSLSGEVISWILDSVNLQRIITQASRQILQ